MRFRWLRAQYGRNENLGHGYVNIGGNKSVENFGTAHPPGEKGSSEPVQSRKSRSDGSGNAHASKTTKRGAAGFGVVFPARKTWASPQLDLLFQDILPEQKTVLRLFERILTGLQEYVVDDSVGMIAGRISSDVDCALIAKLIPPFVSKRCLSVRQAD